MKKHRLDLSFGDKTRCIELHHGTADNTHSPYSNKQIANPQQVIHPYLCINKCSLVFLDIILCFLQLHDDMSTCSSAFSFAGAVAALATTVTSAAVTSAVLSVHKATDNTTLNQRNNRLKRRRQQRGDTTTSPPERDMHRGTWQKRTKTEEQRDLVLQLNLEDIEHIHLGDQCYVAMNNIQLRKAELDILHQEAERRIRRIMSSSNEGDDEEEEEDEEEEDDYADANAAYRPKKKITNV
jgi:hypothetical protein